ADVPAAYPPGAELVLYATAYVGDVVGHPKFPLRLVLVACDLFVLLALYRRSASTNAFVTYGAHPLPILEIAIAGHLDGLVIEAPFEPLFEERAARGEYMHVHVATDPFGFLVEDAGTPLVSIGDARPVDRKIVVDAGFVARAIAFVVLIVALALIARRAWVV